jgi:hypothetical protein
MVVRVMQASCNEEWENRIRISWRENSQTAAQHHGLTVLMGLLHITQGFGPLALCGNNGQRR